MKISTLKGKNRRITVRSLPPDATAISSMLCGA
jgi:hypothetical protein